MCKIRPIQRVPGAVVTGQDRVIFHPDRGNVHFRMRKGGEEEQWRKWHARPHRRTDGPAGNCIARIGRNCASVYLPRSSAAFSVRSSVVPRPRVRAPMSSFLCPLTIVNRRPPVPAPPPSVRRRFTLPREARGLFPENGSQIERNFQGTNRGPGLNRVAVLRLMGD